MFIIDAHQDIAYNALCYDRDYRQSIFQLRQQDSAAILAEQGLATLGLPEALLGRVGLVFATIFSLPVVSGAFDSPRARRLMYTTPQEAYTNGIRQLDYYNRLVDQTEGRVSLVKNQSDLERILAAWADGTETRDHRQGLVLLMENAEPILEPRQFEEWYQHGVRLVGPAWRSTRYCGGTAEPGPLTKLGYELLDVMAGFNAVLDLSHMAEKAVLQALDYYPGIIIASHTNPRRFKDTDRHFTPEMIDRLAERDGVMGVVLYNKFLNNTWKSGDPRLPMTVIADVIDEVCQRTGSAKHIGIGTDLDGGFGQESIPQSIDSVLDLHKIGDLLRQRGYAPSEIEAVLMGNMLRKLRQALPV